MGPQMSKKNRLGGGGTILYSYIAPATKPKCEITINKWNTQVVFFYANICKYGQQAKGRLNVCRRTGIRNDELS